MTVSPIRRGGIIAAGEGSRLQGRGPKPLVRVGGMSLLDHALSRFLALGLEEGVLIARDERVAESARTWSSTQGWPLKVLVEATPSSAVSFRKVVEALGPGRALLTTVDALFPASALQTFLDVANALPEDAMGLGTTTWVDDEKPLWIDWDRDGRVTALGKAAEEARRGVTAGLYVVPHALLEIAADHPDEAPLRRLLGAWFDHGRATYALPLPKVLDVDRPEDLEAAEAFLREDPTR